MCGIAGGIWTDGRECDDALNVTNLMQRHRGPDGKGKSVINQRGRYIGLAHTRLAIIDLSESGLQPMESYCGQYEIVFNGEIYNYREIRRLLELEDGVTFFSDTDTEVLLRAWSKWGKRALSRLVGMFSFAIYDKSSQRLTCVRDAFGIKPFFYCLDSEFRFASEMQTILKIKGGEKKINWQKAYDYLCHAAYDHDDETFISGVRSLRPGHLAEISLKENLEFRIESWWAPKVEETQNWSFDSATEAVRESFLNNVKLHLRSDVDVGVALSGGIDSSAVACAVRYLEPDIPIKTFSFIADSKALSEEVFIDLVNGEIGAKPFKARVSPSELFADLEDLIRTQGEPFGTTSVYAQYRVFKMASEMGIKVTLDGQGADEILGGYIGHPGQRLRSLLERREILAACNFLNQWPRVHGSTKLTAMKYLAAASTSSGIQQLLRRLDGKGALPAYMDARALSELNILPKKPARVTSDINRGRRLVEELALSLSTRGLPHLLRHGDRNSMRWSVESRVPFLTQDFADLMLSMPESFLVSQNGLTKNVFRAAMEGIVPAQILERTDKIGFETPQAAWLTNSQIDWAPLEPIVRSLPFLNPRKLLSRLEAKGHNGDDANEVWRFFNLLKWIEIFEVDLSV